MLDTQSQKSVGDLWFPESAIETVHEFIDVLLKAMGTHSAMVGPEQKTFEVGDDDVGLRQPIVGFFLWCDFCDMCGVCH
jgi:hypothetical protein